MLAIVGGALGLILASFTLTLIQRTNPGSLPRASEIRMDWRVLGFTLAVSLLTGVLFGIAPFIHVSAIRVYETLKTAGGRSSANAASNRFRRFLVIAQVAMAFLLVAGAGLMIRAFWKLQQVNAGFNPAHVLTFSLNLPSKTYKDNNTLANFSTILQERLNQIPGVKSVSLSEGLPPIRPRTIMTPKSKALYPCRTGRFKTSRMTRSPASAFSRLSAQD